MRKVTFFMLFILSFQFSIAGNKLKPIYKDSTVKIERRIKDLVSKMNLDEKIKQISQYPFYVDPYKNNVIDVVRKILPEIGSVIYCSADPLLRNEIQKNAVEKSRLGIPILFGYDVIHGFRTVYPISLAQACSWNPDLVSKACAMSARESRLSGIDWVFSPMIDVARDPRWGRVAEGYGEDPYTNAVFGVASVKGYQGKKLSDPYSVATCLKHYVGYGESEGGRDYHYTDISRQSLWETYMVPYEACVKAGAATLMSAFNDISGIPATANYYTLTEVLKKRWKHDGFVISDWNAIEQLVNQGVAANRKEAGYKAFTSGVEMDMNDNVYIENLPQLIAEKKVSMNQLNEAVSRVLRVKFRLGLFEHPYTTIVKESDRYVLPESKSIARQLARESMVLLKNENGTLPLKTSMAKIALIGPLVKDKIDIQGSWAGHAREVDVESIYEGFQHILGNEVTINFAPGCDFEGYDQSGFAEALSVAQQSDIVVVCLGEKRAWTGENASRSSIALPAIQEQLVQELKKTGKPIVLVLSNGRPLELMRLEPIADAIVEMWQPGIAGGSALAEILSGKVNPSGKLAMTFPLTTGQIPVYYNMRQSARPTEGKYQDISTEPLYPFGFGLSYTTFNYGKLKLSGTVLNKTQKLSAEIEVENDGKMDGTETVFWYISDPSCTITRPLKELKHFEKKEIAPGQKAIYHFEIDPLRDLSYINASGDKILESGDYFIIVNNQKVKFEIKD